MTVDLKKFKKTYNYLYRVTNKLNHKIYIGCHQTDNLEDGYLGSGKAIKKAIHKYGPENFEKTILEYFDNAEDMFMAEAKVVTREFIKGADNYNIAEGGKGGYKGEECYSNPIRNTKLSIANQGIATAVDQSGTVLRVSKTYPRWLTKELVGHTIGRSTVKDVNGKIYKVSVDDPRVSTGELVGITKGLAMVKDSQGNRYQVSKDDPRIKSGELVGITKGSQQSADSNHKRAQSMLGRKMPQPMVTCQFCGKTTSRTNIIRWHKKCGPQD
jgi:hypothetical protein